MNQAVSRSDIDCGTGCECARWILLVMGMAFFWPAISLYRLNPATLVPDEGQASFSACIGTSDLFWAVTALAGGLALGLLGLRRAGMPPRAPRRALVVSEIALVGCLAAGALTAGSSDSVACQATTGVAAACYLLALCCSWAQVADAFANESRLLAALLASFVLTVPLAWLAQEGASLAHIGMSNGEALLSLASGPLCLASLRLAPQRCLVSRQSEGGNGVRRTVAAASSTFTMWATVVVYLVFTTVLRIVSMVGLEPDEALTKSSVSKVMLALLGAILLTVALVSNKNVEPDDSGHAVRYPWAPFLALCLAALYASIAFFQVSPWLCRAVIFPSRMCADALLFLLAIEAARRLKTSTPPLSCLLFPTVLAVQRLVLIGAYAWASGLSSGAAASFVLPVTAATALVTTACTALCLWQVLSRRTQPAPEHPDAGGEHSARLNACQALGKRFSLTERELQVLELLSSGYGQKGIAAELGLATNTVHSYTKSLYAKTGIHSRQEAVDLVNGHGRTSNNCARIRRGDMAPI